MNINLSFDASAASMPSAMVAAIEYAANFYSVWFTNPITVNIAVGYGEIGGVALGTSDLLDGAADARFNYLQTSYSALKPILAAQDGGAVLPSADPTGGAGVFVPNAEAKALGIMSATATGMDGYIGFNSVHGFNLDPNNRAAPGMEDFTGIALHEISEALGRRTDGFSPVGAWTVANLFRYSAPGVLAHDGTPSYFSIDGGVTNLGNYSLGEDYLDWDYNTTGLDAFRNGITLDTVSPITPRDEAQMAALGFTQGPGQGLGLPHVIQTDTNSLGSTLLTEAATEYFLYNATGFGPYLHNATGFGPYLQFGGAVVLQGISFGDWVPIGAVQTASGYDVAWEIPGANEYTVWSTDNNGNYIANIIGVVPGNDYALQSMETTFNQDLNGDGTIGLTTIAIHTNTNSFGPTSLMAVANEYFISEPNVDPVLLYAGAPVTAGEFGSWTPIGAVQTATGYNVAWEIPGANEYTVWSTDNNGNYIANIIGVVPGNDYTLQSMETTFNQDLNGDGTIGLTTIAIHTNTNSFGPTSLMAVANEYFISEPNVDPVLLYAGAPVTAGEFGSWTPIGAVQTATGYNVAWEIPGANEYTVWSTDNNGNYIANIIGVVPGNDYTLQSMETTFNQDLNGDGTIGLTTIAIHTNTNSFGPTSLMAVANEYFFSEPNADPVLLYAGDPVTAGEFGSWVPIGAVQTASGYDVAWKIPGANAYTVWSTDSNGNYIANIIGTVVGNDYALQSIEKTFNQDLNGDGVIGLTGTVIQTDTNSFGSASLMELANSAYFISTASADPLLLYAGALVTAGEFDTWVPIGAVQTASGYDAAWKIPGANAYTVWSTDSDGNYIANIIGVVSGNDYALESIETTFNQDLNGDGTIGLTKTTIQSDANSFGLTRLTAVADEYFLYYASGSGPALQYAGTPVTAGEFDTWVPIGAVQTASGYDVAWEIPGANAYTVWSTDSNGNYIANIIGTVAGNDYALESIETTFNQDLNGDGTIGLTKTTIQSDANSFGLTRLTAVADEYFLYNASGSGPALQYAGTPVTAGEFDTWVPIGAVQTASGYDVAWKIPGANAYTVWSTDSNGNYIANIIGTVAGNEYALESIETTFNQDLNGDGVVGLYAAPGTLLQINASLAGPSGSASIGIGATLELQGVDSASVTFRGSTGTLQLDNSPTFSGQIFNFTGNGSLSGSDQIDLRDISYNSVQDSYANGVLTVTDGGNSAELSFSGSYTLANFDLASDGSGGTIVYDPPVANSSSQNVTAHNATSTSPPASATIGTGATLELAAANAEAVTFTGWTGTLILDGAASAGQAFNFMGAVSGFAGQSAIDFTGIAFDAKTKLSYSSNNAGTGGTLSLTDGTHDAKIKLLGDYLASSFVTAGDAHGGTLVVAETSLSGNQSVLVNPHHA